MTGTKRQQQGGDWQHLRPVVIFLLLPLLLPRLLVLPARGASAGGEPLAKGITWTSSTWRSHRWMKKERKNCDVLEKGPLEKRSDDDADEDDDAR